VFVFMILIVCVSNVGLVYLYLCFFFSSRRRHTRCSRDWSSDVCSSDLHIHISEIELLSFVEGVVELKVACSKGTYIRTLAEDVAKALETVSYVTKLHRLEVGSFKDFPMVTIEELEQLAEEGELHLDKSYCLLISAL